MRRIMKTTLLAALLSLGLANTVSAGGPEARPIVSSRAARELTRGRYIITTPNRSHIAIRERDEHGQLRVKLVATPVRNNDPDHALSALFGAEQAHLTAAKLIGRGLHVEVERASPDQFGVPSHAWDLGRLRHEPLHTGFAAAVKEYEAETEEVEAAPPAR